MATDLLRLDRVRVDILKPFIDGIFEMSLPGGEAVPVRLIRIGQVPGGSSSQSLSIHFHSPQIVNQGIYQFSNPELGAMTIFVVPIRAMGSGIILEAIFNRQGSG